MSKHREKKRTFLAKLFPRIWLHESLWLSKDCEFRSPSMWNGYVHSFLGNVYELFAQEWPVTLPGHWWPLVKRDLRNLRQECMQTQGLGSNEPETGAPQSKDPRNIQELREAKRPESKYMPTTRVITVEVLSQDTVKGWGLCSFSFLPPILYFPQMRPLLFSMVVPNLPLF